MPLTAAKFRDEVVPPGLSESEQMTFCIGHLVMSWAQCEGLFFGLLACFVQGDQGQPHIVWLNTNSSRARAYYVQRLAVASSLDRPTVEEIKGHVKNFKSVTTTRNMFCHATYQGDYKTGDMLSLESYELVDDERVFTATHRKLGKALINECINAIVDSFNLHQRMWLTLATVRELMGAQHLALPPELPEYLAHQGLRPANGKS